MSSLDCVVSGFEPLDDALAAPLVTFQGVTLTQGGAKIPAIVGTWTTPTNPYITTMRFEFGPSDLSSGIMQATERDDAQIWTDTRVLAGKQQTVRYRAEGIDVIGPWSAPVTVTIPSNFVSTDTATVDGKPAADVKNEVNQLALDYAVLFGDVNTHEDLLNDAQNGLVPRLNAIDDQINDATNGLAKVLEDLEDLITAPQSGVDARVDSLEQTRTDWTLGKAETVELRLVESFVSDRPNLIEKGDFTGDLTGLWTLDSGVTAAADAALGPFLSIAATTAQKQAYTKWYPLNVSAQLSIGFNGSSYDSPTAERPIAYIQFAKADFTVVGTSGNAVADGSDWSKRRFSPPAAAPGDAIYFRAVLVKPASAVARLAGFTRVKVNYGPAARWTDDATEVTGRARVAELRAATVDLTNLNSTAYKLSVVEATLNTPGTGLLARASTLETATTSLVNPNSHASRLSVQEARIRIGTNIIPNGGLRRYPTGANPTPIGWTFGSGTVFDTASEVGTRARATAAFYARSPLIGVIAGEVYSFQARTTRYAGSDPLALYLTTSGGTLIGTGVFSVVGANQLLLLENITIPAGVTQVYLFCENSGGSNGSNRQAFRFKGEAGAYATPFSDDLTEAQLNAAVTDLAFATTDTTNGVSLASKLSNVQSDLNTPVTGLQARHTSLVEATTNAANQNSLAFKLDALNSQVNTAQTGIAAKVTSYGQTIADLPTNYASASQLALVQAQAILNHNLIRNAGMTELDSITGFPVGWLYAGFVYENAIDIGPRMIATTTDPYAYTPGFAVTPGMTISASVRTTRYAGSGSMQFDIVYYQANGTTYVNQSSPVYADVGENLNLKIENQVVPSGAAIAKLRVLGSGANVTNRQAYRFKAERGAVATSWTDEATAGWAMGQVRQLVTTTGSLASGKADATRVTTLEATANARANIVPNGGMTRPTAPGITPVLPEGWLTGGVTYDPVSEVGPRLLSTATDPYGLSPIFTVLPGSIYSGQCRTTRFAGAGPIQVDIVWYQADGTTVVSSSTAAFADIGHSLLTKIENQTCPAGATKARIRAFASGANVTNRQFHSFKVELGALCTSFTNEAAQVTLDSRVTITEKSTADLATGKASTTLVTELSSRAVAGNNLVPNGGMTALTGGLPNGGYYQEGCSFNATSEFGPRYIATGNITVITPGFTVRPGIAYSASCRTTRYAGSAPVAFYIRWRTGGSPIGTSTATNSPVGENQLVTVENAVAPAGADTADLVVYGVGTPGANRQAGKFKAETGQFATVWSDDATLRELRANLTISGQTLTDLESNLALAKFTVVAAAAGGRPARLGLQSTNQGPSGIALDADQIWFGDNTQFWDDRNTIETTLGSPVFQRYVMGGPIGGSDLIFDWVGPSTVARGSETKNNAFAFTSGVSPYNKTKVELLRMEPAIPWTVTSTTLSWTAFRAYLSDGTYIDVAAGSSASLTASQDYGIFMSLSPTTGYAKGTIVQPIPKNHASFGPVAGDILYVTLQYIQALGSGNTDPVPTAAAVPTWYRTQHGSKPAQLE